MSEVIIQEPHSEQSVFGDAFSFKNGVGQEYTVKALFEERVASIESGAKTWLPKTLDTDGGVCADLFKSGKLVATLHLDYNDYSTSDYATIEGGYFGDTTLCDRVTLAQAVTMADQLVE